MLFLMWGEIMLLRCCFAWLLLLAPLATRALAATEVDTGKPNAVSAPRNPLTTPQTKCPLRPEAGIGSGSTMIVALASDTLWRPRGSEVRFTVNNSGQTAAIQQVRVCFGWSSAAAQAEGDAFHALQASPIVRSVASSDGVPSYGAIMPALADTAQPWWVDYRDSTSSSIVLSLPCPSQIWSLKSRRRAAVLRPSSCCRWA
jgi:hypothetical protein